jgi:myo-inositol-1(or 4)-monophosphatase
MNLQNLTSTREKTIPVIQKAGEILCSYFGSNVLISTSKGGVDFVTQADIEVDRFLVQELTKLFPESTFLTEETAPDSYDDLQHEDDVWVIDPLDGTTNFSRQREHFAIAVALVQRGEAELGFVYLPLENKFYWAQKDHDTAVLNDRQIVVSSNSDIGTAVIATDWPWDMAKRNIIISALGPVMQSVRACSMLGSAASDVATVATGILDGYFHSGLKPWDIAASALILQKAGGSITRLDGTAWNMFCPDILATNGKIHKQLLELIRS